MRKLAIILVVLCLGLSGCNVLHEVSHYFAGVEDFVRGNRDSTTPAEQKDSQEGTDEDTDEGDDGTGEPHALAAVCFRQDAEVISVRTAADETPEGLGGCDLVPDEGTRFCEMGTLEDGGYFLELTDVDVGFTVAGSDLTLMLAINDYGEGREVRAVPLPGLITAGPSQGE